MNKGGIQIALVRMYIVVFSFDSPKINNFDWLVWEILRKWWLVNGVSLSCGLEILSEGRRRVFIPIHQFVTVGNLFCLLPAT